MYRRFLLPFCQTAKPLCDDTKPIFKRTVPDLDKIRSTGKKPSSALKVRKLNTHLGLAGMFWYTHPMTIVAIIIELVVLFILSRRLTQNMYNALFLLFRSRPVAITIISVIYFPGTIIHELAHLFTAEILQVRTSGLTLVPEGLENPEVRTGSVMIAQTDPIRRAIIGVAPVFVGLGVLGVISYFIPQLWQQALLDARNSAVFTSPALYVLLLALYSLFAVSNTMFASREDMDGFWPVALVLTLIGLAAYLVGIRISLTPDMASGIRTFLTSVATNLGWVTGLNLVLFLLSKLVIAGVERLTKRKLIQHH